MSQDLQAVGTGLGSAFAAVTAPAGTMGGTVIRGSTVGLQNVPATPYIAVELPSGDVTTEDPGQRRMTHDFEVYFLFQKSSADVPRDTKVMLQWLGPLLNALQSNNALDLEDETGWHVLKTRTTTYEPGQYDVSGQPYHSWHLTVRVWTEDAFLVTA